jgi:N-[(2S)-2-amino-2-carboxyethyl]-L-glutamate dehydrogenase
MLVDAFGADRFDFVVVDLIPDRAAAAAKLARTLGAKSRVVTTPQEAVEAADIVIPATTSERSYIQQPWLKQNCLYCAVSLLDADLDIYRASTYIVVDDLDQCLHENRPLDFLNKKGDLRTDCIFEIGNILGTDRQWGRGQGQIIFNPMGTIMTDLAVAKTLFDRALASGDFVSLEV